MTATSASWGLLSAMSWDRAISRGKGAARRSGKEFIQFLHVALGSVSEVETQVVIAQRLNYVDDTRNIDEQIEAVSKLILGLVRYLKRQDAKE